MTKMLIGLTTTRMLNPFELPAYGINEPYVTSVINAGGLPVLIPLGLSHADLDALLQHLDGILFTGGSDIDPKQYGNQPHPKVEGADSERDQIEIHLVREAIKLDKPFLGICRGLQVINVALGGSLFEHLPDQLPGDVRHDNHHMARDFLAHSVNVESGSRLSRITSGDQLQVNSLHHQGIRRLADGLLATAYAADGLIEAVEYPGHSFGLAVQWHPEELQENQVMRQIFQAFVCSCQETNSA
jgi:putative glutamine amidotransferase